MKEVKAPRGYEKMDVEWTVDPARSATHLMGNAPVGWQFYELNREKTKVVVTYIRKLEPADLRTVIFSGRIDSNTHNKTTIDAVRRELERRLPKLIDECITTAPLDRGDAPIRANDFKITCSTTVITKLSSTRH